MRIAFAGTPAFAAKALAALIEAGFEIVLALSQPDRPAGRGQQRQPSPVKRLALAHGIPVATPASLRPERGDPETGPALAQLREAQADVLVVAAYGLLLPAPVLALPQGLPLASGGRASAINIHASLLPRWRGAAPIVRAIEAGDTRTGISIMQMDEGLDTGPVLLTAVLDIGSQTSAGELTEQLAALGAHTVVEALRAGAQGRLYARPQPAEGVLYARKVEKREAWVDWSEPAARIAARVRAFDPFPGACALWDGVTIKFWRAQVEAPARDAPERLAPGTVVSSSVTGIRVACGPGGRERINLIELQRPGGRRMDVRAFLAGQTVAPGGVWSCGVPPEHER